MQFLVWVTADAGVAGLGVGAFWGGLAVCSGTGGGHKGPEGSVAGGWGPVQLGEPGVDSGLFRLVIEVGLGPEASAGGDKHKDEADENGEASIQHEG